ncbi:MAG: GntR family transcriptional regulator [Lentisphaeria bacterium]|nr:GntR family transcriptional regulator [Lentisphaeria bacterium]
MSIVSKPPKYIVVKQAIQESILRDLLPPQSRLAPISRMSAHFGVSPSVIQHALNDMVDDGFIECRGASGYYVRGTVGQAGASVGGTDPGPDASRRGGYADDLPPVFLSCSHHSDLVWRRTYEEADKIRRRQTGKLIDIAEQNPDFHFYFEQSETPVRLPEYRRRLEALLKTGQAEMIGGMCIPDLNMISGETLIRALLRGRADYRKTFGIVPVIACLTDAFGMPIQTPQVLALCGYRYLIPGRLPNPTAPLDTGKPFCWKGANGTSVLVSAPVQLNDIGNLTNVPVIYDPRSQSKRELEALASGMERHFAVFCKEEGLFQESFCRLVDEVNRYGMRELRFSAVGDYFDWIAGREHPCYKGEFNPVFTGCYSTRIGNKQQFRRAEILMRRAEMLAAADGRELASEAQEKELLRTAFHDSLCGCCTDAAQRGITKKIAGVLAFAEKQCAPTGTKTEKKTFFVANTSSVGGRQLVCSETAPAGTVSEMIGDKCFFYADLPPVGGKIFPAGVPSAHAEKIGADTIKTSCFAVDFSGKYPKITAPFNVFGEQFSAIRIRPDFGSMWTERFKAAPLADECSQEEPFTVLEGPIFFHAFSVGRIAPEPAMIGHTGKPWNGFRSLAWKKEFLFPKDQDCFFLKITLDFKGRNTKILVDFPLLLDPFSMVRTDSVPFGSLVRKPYFEVESRYERTMRPLDQASSRFAMGDWPVLDWSDFSDARTALAIANSGTPGCSVSGSHVAFSLLRSGTGVEDGCLEPDPGSYDNGIHEYRFAFRAHEPGGIDKAAELGNILNRMPTESRLLSEGEWLSWDRGNIALSAAMRKDGRLILRFYEFCGRKTAVTLSGSWVDGKTIREITPEGDFLKDVPARCADFAPFEIKTLAVET